MVIYSGEEKLNMARCYKNCKYRSSYFCTKYGEPIQISKNMCHPGLNLHPLDYLSLYYKDSSDIEHLIEVAEKYSDEPSSKNICKQYRETGKITYKQRKLLVYNILNCYESEDDNYHSIGNDGLMCQVED
jgi:hypothetical protein